MRRKGLVCLLALGSAGCTFGPKKVVKTLPPPATGAMLKPAPVLSLPPSVRTIDPQGEGVPAPVAKAEEEEILPPPVAPPTEEPKKPAPRRPRQAAVVPTPAPTPAAAPETPAPEAAVPQLREILTPERRAQYEGEFAQSVGRARAALNQAVHRRLSDAQRENVSRIETFLTQAEAARTDDLGTALQLARRADLLGQDLVKSLLP